MAVAKKAVYLTAEGLRKLKEELQHLTEVRRPEIAAKLKRALEFGDLSENAEYQEAREDQAMTEARIAELEEQIRNVEMIDEAGSTDFGAGETVQMGSKVTVMNTQDGEKTEETYVIVGSTEANPLEGRISNESPLGNALLDHKVGEKVKFKAPAGMQEYKITALE